MTLLAAPVVANAGVVTDAIASVSGADATGGRDAVAPAAPTAETEAVVELSLAPTVGTTVDPGGIVTVEVEVDNRTGDAIPAGQLRLTRAATAITDQSGLDAWTGAAATDERSRPRAEPVGEVAVRALPAGASEIVSFALPPGSLGATDGAPVVGVGAELVVDQTTTATATAAFPTVQASGPGPQVALAYALTVPAESAGLIDADALELWTGPAGLLTRQLDAVADRAVAIALDPRIVASIRALGTGAPPSAVAWLERLAAVPNEVFPLAYADADLAAQAQLGIDPLTADSFTDVLDPADFADEPAGTADDAADDADDAGDAGGQAGDADPVATTQPTDPAVPPSDVPTTEQLLAWPYTRTDLAWPADATVATGNLAAFAAGGYTTTILSGSNVEATDLDVNAASTVEGESAVVADARISAALRDAAAARSDVSWGDAAARLGAELAIRADDSGDAVLLATFQRGASTQSPRVAATLDALASWPWARAASLSGAVGAAPVERTLVDAPEDPQRLSDLRRLLDSEAAVQEFATVLDDESLLTGPARRQLLALFDVSWMPQPAEWATALGERLIAQAETVNAVSVAQSSPVNVLSSETGVPTTVENLLPYPVTVFVDVAPSNGRLIVEERVETTVAADSRSNVIVPVAAGVGNGEVTLSVSLWSRDDVKVGQTVQIAANVQADWEGLGALILGVVVVVFFGVGIWRNIRRRRRERAAQEAATAEAPDGAATDDSSEHEDVGGSQYTASHAESDSSGPDAAERSHPERNHTTRDHTARSDERKHTERSHERDHTERSDERGAADADADGPEESRRDG